MEVAVAKALKPSLQTEFVFSQEIRNEILCLNANNVVVGEDFSVDDLLDFSNGKEMDDYEEEEEEEEEEKGSTVSGGSQDRIEEDSNSNSTAAGDSDSIFAGELAVPVSFFFPFKKKLFHVIIQFNNSCPVLGFHRLMMWRAWSGFLTLSTILSRSFLFCILSGPSKHRPGPNRKLDQAQTEPLSLSAPSRELPGLESPLVTCGRLTPWGFP